MNLELLLREISNLNKKYEEIYRLTGEKFNIFNILNLSEDEKTHSKIIAALLDPKGAHGKGNKFIEMFLDCTGINDFCADNVTVETEEFIGFISENYDSGGRIDIALTNNEKQQIFIENKINAEDQRNQLFRYSKENPKVILYLTLFGDEPSEYSTGGEKIDYEKISYKEHILKWLELCKMEAIDNPLLRETLTQYIVLIKELTLQARSKEMEEEFLDIIIKDADNVSAAFTISENIDKVKHQILADKFLPLIKELAGELGLETDISWENIFVEYWGFDFYKPEWKKLRINFSFEKSNLRWLFYGFTGINIPKELQDKYSQSLKYKPSEDWPLYKYMDKYINWDKEFFTDLFTNKENVKREFENKITELLSILKENKELQS